MDIPPFTTGTVTSPDGSSYGVNVILDGWGAGQMTAMPCSVLTHGPRDAVRGHWPSLPTPGTRVLVAIPRGDLRNATVVGSLPGPFNTSSPHSASVLYASHTADFSGWWDYRDEKGHTATVWPDGTSLTVGSGVSPAVPVPTRYIVTSGQGIVQQAFSQQQRVPTPPAAFAVALRLASGTVVDVDPSGAVTVTVQDGQPLTLNASGGTVVIDGSGNVEITGKGTITATAAHIVAVTADMTVTNGGTVLPVRLSDGSNSTNLKAQK